MMIAMKFTALVTILAVLMTTAFGALVGSQRGKSKLSAPSVDGDETFQRAFRVHYNTIENLVVFLPVLWLSTGVIGDLWTAVIGAVWLLGRLLYQRAYMSDPSTRLIGMLLTMLPTGILSLVALWGVIRQFL